jgi:hypothetical protein
MSDFPAYKTISVADLIPYALEVRFRFANWLKFGYCACEVEAINVQGNTNF